MYTDHEGQEQDLQKKDVMNCLDQEQMQAMQDQFCQTQGLLRMRQQKHAPADIFFWYKGRAELY